ncbi:putative membrane domain protein, partial [Chlamydia psittaci 06-1683]
MVLFL